ncbi:MAG: hypothetical protein AAGJ40_05705 [Planctomycetota bacterium]
MFDVMMVGFIIVVFFAAIWIWESKRQRDFMRKWSPISDNEFIAKCSTGTDRARALRVRRIIAEELDVPYEHIHPEQRFVEDLDCC